MCPLNNDLVSFLVKKIDHFLVTHLGKLENEVTIQEFYYAFCVSLREELMTYWSANLHSFNKTESRMLYYFSMEYLPGKFLNNNITNIGGWDLLKAVMARTGRNLSDLLDCEPDPGLGNGGLGRLASCLLDALATLRYPAWGYGLRYQYGIFEQEIWGGRQVERPDHWLKDESPWEVRKYLRAASVYFRGNMIRSFNSYGDEVYNLEDYEEVRALPYDFPIIGYGKNPSIISLRLWTTKESARNFELQRYNAGQLDQAGENGSLTDVLYPNDNHDTGKRIRLKQEFLLVSASLQDIVTHHMELYKNINSLAEKTQIQINDTHAAFIIAELIRILNQDYDLPWKKSVEMVQSICNYTNHTILKEALEEWNEQRVSQLLPRQYKIIQKLNFEFCNLVRKTYSNDEGMVNKMSILKDGQIRMANLAIVGCKKVNGVSQMHTNILKNSVFKEFNDIYPNKFVNVTNGVTPRRWILCSNRLLSQFITNRIGDKWITNFSYIEELHKFAEEESSLGSFLALKNKNKERFLNYLHQSNPIRGSKGKVVHHSSVLDSTAILDVHIKRFHEYKRQLLNALHAIMLYHEIKKGSVRKAKRMIIFGGKAAPGYEAAKNIIQLIYCIVRKINIDPMVAPLLQVSFLENYNVSKAEIIIPAADLSEQISMAGMEASGTGNMKLAMNGALTIGTEDGANIEMRKAITDQWWPFSFGAKMEEVPSILATYNPQDILNQYPAIKKAVEALKDDTLASSKEESAALTQIYDSLMYGNGKQPDRYLVLKDLPAYYETQKRVEDLYANHYLWAKYALHNIASMGQFSSDKVIENYAKQIWEIKPVSLDQELIKTISEAYNEEKIFIT